MKMFFVKKRTLLLIAGIVWLLSAGHTFKQENAKDRSAYDTKNLCIYMDDSYGTAIAVSIMISFFILDLAA